MNERWRVGRLVTMPGRGSAIAIEGERELIAYVPDDHWNDQHRKRHARTIAAAPDGLTLAHMVLTTATVETPPELIAAAEAFIAKVESG